MIQYSSIIEAKQKVESMFRRKQKIVDSWVENNCFVFVVQSPQRSTKLKLKMPI